MEQLFNFLYYKIPTLQKTELRYSKCVAVLLISLFSISLAKSEYSFNVGASLNAGIGSNEFAPFYLRANDHGKLTQSKNFQLDIWATDSLDLSKRFDFSWGVEALGGYASKTEYMRWDPTIEQWQPNPQGPAPIWIQQLYGEVKWRCLFLSVGLKDYNSAFVYQNLSSGDLLWSGNSRGIPEVRIGFVDFQDIPFTKKWLQFDVALSYGKFIDTKFINNHFNGWNGKKNPGGFWTYKRASLRTNPDKPFSFHAGIQMTGIFGGITYYYFDGQETKRINNYNGFKDFFQILLPFWGDEREGYRVGDTKGTWDFAARYRFKDGESLRAYVQWPWEDSSGIAKKNGFDGLWGLEFKLNRHWWITGIVAEYLDLTHMSGPVGFDSNYHNTPENGGQLSGKVAGRDGYYNNSYYRDYTNYGLNMGTPMVAGNLFYTGKPLFYTTNASGQHPYIPESGTIPYFRVRGFHIAIEGEIGPFCTYTVKYNHRKAWGDTNRYTLTHPVEADSFMAGATYGFSKIPGLSLSAVFGFDKGNYFSNAVAGMVTLTYERPIIFKR